LKKLKSKFFTKEILRDTLVPLASVLLALLLGMVILLIARRNPITAYAALFKGAFGSMSFIGDTLSRATPIIFTGLAVAFAFRCGLFNIGVEGQLIVGALASACVGYYVKGLPTIIHLPLSILAGAAAGALWSAVPGILKAWKGVHEVINTIMMNYIAYAFSAYAVEALRPGVAPKTPKILDSAILAPFAKFIPAFKGSSVNMGFILALAACGIIYLVLGKTVLGYEVRAVGFNPFAAEDGGIKVRRNIIYAMVISGALAGLGGAERVLGYHYSFISGLSPGYGFDGIAVALLANNNPLGIILSGIIFGALSSGGLYMDMSANVSSDIVIIIQALIIFFMAANEIAKRFMFRRKRKETA
jgi:simple sugar transport system permease protein